MSVLCLMNDLETIGLDDDAGIVQIGLVAFDPETFQPVSQFKCNIDTAALLMEGFSYTKETMVDFWSKQSPEAKQSVFYSEVVSPRQAAHMVNTWLLETFDGHDMEVWACGILFDVVKLDNLLSHYGIVTIQERTKYSAILDYRSIRKFTQRVHPIAFKQAEALISNSRAHDALADCLYQIAMLDACHQICGGTFLVTDGDDTDIVAPAVDREIHNGVEVGMGSPQVVIAETPEWDDHELEGDVEFESHLIEPKVITESLADRVLRESAERAVDDLIPLQG